MHSEFMNTPSQKMNDILATNSTPSLLCEVRGADTPVSLCSPGILRTNVTWQFYGIIKFKILYINFLNSKHQIKVTDNYW